MILGIDPGLGKLGLCTIEGDNVTSQVLITTDKKLKGVARQIVFLKSYVLPEDSPIVTAISNADLIMIEKPYGIGGYGVILMELLGLLKYFVIKYNKPFAEIPQTTLKKFATGNGRAEKSDMRLTAYKSHNFEASSEDEVDAFFLAKAGHCLTFQDQYPKWQKDSLSKIQIVI